MLTFERVLDELIEMATTNQPVHPPKNAWHAIQLGDFLSDTLTGQPRTPDELSEIQRRLQEALTKNIELNGLSRDRRKDQSNLVILPQTRAMEFPRAQAGKTIEKVLTLTTSLLLQK